MLGTDIEKKEADKGIYKGYKIVKTWQEKRGRRLDYTVKYTAYDSNGDCLCCEEKLKDLKSYIDSIGR